MDAEVSREPLESRPRLWNPAAAGFWGFVLCPAMGAFLHAENWRALKRSDRAAVSMRWFWFFALFQGAALVVTLFVPLSESVAKSSRSLGLVLMALWLMHSRAQTKYVKETLTNDYERRPWGVPLSIGAASLAAVIVSAMCAPDA